MQEQYQGRGDGRQIGTGLQDKDNQHRHERNSNDHRAYSSSTQFSSSSPSTRPNSRTLFVDYDQSLRFGVSGDFNIQHFRNSKPCIQKK